MSKVVNVVEAWHALLVLVVFTTVYSSLYYSLFYFRHYSLYLPHFLTLLIYFRTSCEISLD